MKSLIKASCPNSLTARYRRAVICHTIDMVLIKGLIGKVIPNQKQILIDNHRATPDFEFVPDINPDLSFLVFESEIEFF
ncbi:MAG: hypothetical protein R2822_29975 [Spirosomataceae bacterium]